MSWGQGEEELAILKIEKKVGQGVSVEQRNVRAYCYGRERQGRGAEYPWAHKICQ